MNNNRNLFGEPFPPHDDQEYRDSQLAKAMDKYGKYLIGFFARNLGDAHRGEELASSLWNHVYRTFKTEQFDNIGLVLHAARQMLGKEFRRMKARRVINTVELRTEDHDIISTRHFETEDEERITQDRFWETFHTLDLPEKHKEAFWLNVIHGYTVREMAEHFMVSKSVVHEWISKLRSKCNNYLTGEKNL